MVRKTTPVRPQSRKNVVVPRGIRNCNPLNIRIGNTWMGERPNPDDTEFEQFVNMECGIRAGFLILRRYIKRYKLNTIRLIVSRWAPSNENATESYIQSVSTQMKLEADTEIKYEDSDTMCKLVSAMIKVECGQLVDMAKIQKGYALA